ncbi:MAG: glycosyltransferase family 39 protein [Phycisphaerae bacterium]|nr:glycosyltransferase family 39 protein [Phycisphaerae bacterium]
MKSKDYRNLTVLLIVIAAFLRLIYIWQTPLDLSPDEAQYWDWARRPLQACYLTKPPMVAYTIGFFTGLGGNSAFFVRLGAVIISAATSLVAYLLIVDVFKSARLGFLMVLTLNLGPIFNIGSVIMTIDPLAMLFWSLTVYFSYKALRNPQWWYLAGLSLGLGLLSKFVLIFLPASILLYLLFVKKDRSCLRTKEPYLGLLLSLLLYTPLLLWNQRNNWCYFNHMFFDHLDSGKQLSIYRFLEFLGSQLGIISPLLFIGIIWSLVVVVREKKREYLFLFFCTVPILLFYFLLSLHQKVQGNWPAVGYFAGTAVFVGLFGTSVNSRKRKFMRAALIVALFFSAYVYIVPFVDLPKRLDLTFKLVGWKELGQRVSEVVEEMERKTGQRPFIFSERYQTTAELAFYVRHQPEVYNINLGRRNNQYDLWQDFDQLVGMDAIYVKSRDEDIEPAVVRAFKGGEKLPSQYFYRKGKILRSFSIFKCYGFKGGLNKGKAGGD